VSCGLHDVLSFETQGRPAVLVASAVFEQAAADQARLLGAPGLARVFVPHPVQDRTDEELRAMARSVAERLTAAIGGDQR
jgi:hypothetical protein